MYYRGDGVAMGNLLWIILGLIFVVGFGYGMVKLVKKESYQPSRVENDFNTRN
jgi:hypothetical protein